MARPIQLQLVLNETYPNKRLQTENSSVVPMVVQDMTQMANFVYTYYMERVKQMKNYYEVSFFCFFFRFIVSGTFFFFVAIAKTVA